MDEYISAYEYQKNVNPSLKNIPISQKNIIDCEYGINFINHSELFNVNYPSTSPNLLASFIKIKIDDSLNLFNNEQKNENNFVNATSNLLYILQGKSEIIIDEEKFILDCGDIMIFPIFKTVNIKNVNNNDLHIYYINDSPLMNYLGSARFKKNFKTSIYSKDFLWNNLDSLSDAKNNRKGILLSNKDTEKIGTNTITPVLWALYNELPPNTVQKTHKHNSVALDLCIQCTDNDNIYTLIGDEIDENGDIINPIKINWKQGEMFITPPGLWHSHNNIGNSFAYILPIQDAGLLLYQRILGIVLN